MTAKIVKTKMKREDLLLVIASAMIAILLWLQVQSHVDPKLTREYSLPLELRNKKEGIVVTKAPHYTTVIAEGSKGALDFISPERIQTYIDLSNAEIGQKEYPIELHAPFKHEAKIRLKKVQQRIHLEELHFKRQKVVLEERGLPPTDLLYDGASLRPSQVTLEGPKSMLARVEKARVSFNLSLLRPGELQPGMVEILGAQNEPLPLIKAIPGVIMITPLVAAAHAKKNILINPTWTGNPAFGYKITRYSVKPSQIPIKGRSAPIATMTAVETEPISLEGATTSFTKKVKLRIPEGIKTFGDANAEVYVEIVPIKG